MGIGFPELLIILVIVFLVFGAGKLPEVMAKLGQGAKAFKEGANGVSEAPKKTVKGAAKAKSAVVKPLKKAKGKK